MMAQRVAEHGGVAVQKGRHRCLGLGWERTQGVGGAPGRGEEVEQRDTAVRVRDLTPDEDPKLCAILGPRL